jgi:hypothetical protein
MSKSQPTVTNPCAKFIEFKSDTGTFFYFDKSIGEKGKNVEIPMPVYFAVLDELSTITGYNKRHDCGIYSNECHSVKNEILRVKTFKGGESVTGLYADIRDNIVAMGGKFTKSVYALLIHDDLSTEFVNFKFRGAAFSAWLDKKINVNQFIIGVTECVEEVNGKNTYQVPIFKAYKMSPEIDAAAIEQDKVLQEYLKVYKAQIPEKELAKAEAVNELTDPPKKEEFVANPGWSKSEKMERAKTIIGETAPSRGKQPVQSMSDINDLPWKGTDEEPQF